MSKEEIKTLTIHNIKSTCFRQAHADGASSSLTPSGFVNLNFYNQRSSIPKGTVFQINDDNTLGKPLKLTEESKEGLIREYEFGVYMDINTCRSLRDLLNQKISEFETLVIEKK